MQTGSGPHNDVSGSQVRFSQLESRWQGIPSALGSVQVPITWPSGMSQNA